MFNLRSLKNILLWSLVSSSLIALTLLVVYITFGSVPDVVDIEYKKGSVYILPFAVSRWYDVFVGPIIILLIALFVRIMDDQRNPNRATYGIGCLVGIFCGLVIGVLKGLIDVLYIEACTFLVISIIASFIQIGAYFASSSK